MAYLREKMSFRPIFVLLLCSVFVCARVPEHVYSEYLLITMHSMDQYRLLLGWVAISNWYSVAVLEYRYRDTRVRNVYSRTGTRVYVLQYMWTTRVHLQMDLVHTAITITLEYVGSLVNCARVANGNTQAVGPTRCLASQ